MTILSNQLLALRSSTTSAVEVEKTKKVSILFAPEEAAKLTPEVVLEIAKTGVESIAEIDQRILKFKESLFGPETLRLERNLLKPEENEKLSGLIRECLGVLSPHLLLRPAQKCLEWLLCQFYISEVQADELLYALFPYHDTNLFTKLSVQVRLPLHFRFLKSFKREPPHRDIIIKEFRYT